MNESNCNSCDDMRKEIELLREELCKQIEVYSGITEKLWKISHKRRQCDKVSENE